MMMSRRLLAAAFLWAVLFPPQPSSATEIGFGGIAPTSRAIASLPSRQSWMNPEITTAWRRGYFGQRTTITVIDDFQSGYRFGGDLGTGRMALRHGEWTRLEARMIAPLARSVAHDFNSGQAVQLRAGLNTLNLSYGMFAAAGYSPSQIRWSPQESSIISHAHRGRAVVVKAAGNDAVAVGAETRNGHTDYLNAALIGSRGAIFVGALSRNGTPEEKASLASYSNFAGNDARVQSSFLTVGVPGNVTGLHGTSFAAPVVAGYSAILGSKFRRATPEQIRKQLLNTARRDTILNYDRAIHGRGEASIARALAPARIR
jgi:hypothetical protein